MKGDFTRFTFDPAKHYTAVRKQQGRVDLDADWNEAADIHSHLDSTQSRDVIGECGAPKKTAGFKIGVMPDGSDLTLSAGRFYVNGTLCETRNASYIHQPNLPNPPALAPQDGRTDLVYLEVWQRHITALEDADLLEPALGGADTATRLQTVWQVKVRPGVSAADCTGGVGTWPPAPPLDQRGTLSTKVTASSTTTSPCLIAPGGGYRGLENRLYRVEIHDGGKPYSWPRPADVVSTSAAPVSGQNKKVTVTDWSVDGTAWSAGQAIELHNTQTDAAGKGGTVARITAVSSSSKTITLDTDISSLSATGLKLRRVATYKWSRDNGAIAFPIKEFASGEPRKVRVKRLGRDQVLNVHPNDWVEVLGDTCELWGQPGTMAAIAAGGIDEAEMKLTLSADVSAHSAETHPKLRRWDQKSEPQTVTGEEIELEDGIKIQFGGKNLQPGDYWCFAARTSTGEIDVLNDAPPSGVKRSFCRLALVTWKHGSDAGKPWLASAVTLCPPTFPPLTDIWAEDVFYDDGGCTSIDADNVQEAIDQLCAQRNLPHHNKHLHGWGIVCGLKVVCGPEDLDKPGDQVSVIVKPGYALDCEGQDIILEREQQILIFDLIREWESAHPEAKPLLQNNDGKHSGEVSLIIERDEHGRARIGLRPYRPSDEGWQSMLQGTLLMDFFQECLLKPWNAIGAFLNQPTGDFDKGSIVPPKRQQLTAVINLVWQLVKPVNGSHIFLSKKEHVILENLYYKLAEILASQTFCGMFHERLFPDYPFPDHDYTTLFGRDAYRRIRIHPGGALGYALGSKGSIGVFDLSRDVLIQELTFPGGDIPVQDVAFSPDGLRLYAVALTTGGDTLFAEAAIRGTDHAWQPIKPVCGHSLLTLQTLGEELYAIDRAAGLYLLNPNQEVIRPVRIGETFYATGHLALDAEHSLAYASASPTAALATGGIYDQVVQVNLENGARQSYPLDAGLYGSDDIALDQTGTVLFAVADPRTITAEENKKLFIFRLDEPKAPRLTVDLGANTEIRLLVVPGTHYMLISYMEGYWLRLFDLNFGTLEEGAHLPVQIMPIGMAYGRVPTDPKAPDSPGHTGNRLRVYVLNVLSSTLTAFPASYLPLKGSSTPSPEPWTPEFLAKLVEYRMNVLKRFLGLVGAVGQSLKDCFCDRLLVDCPDCSEADDVYLARVAIRDNEVYQVCNFAQRKYVKSFPTLEYWLSFLPVMPLFHKAIEEICCLILPGLVEDLHKQPKDMKVGDRQLRFSYMFLQQEGMKAAIQKAGLKFQASGTTMYDWIGENLRQAVAPPVMIMPEERILGREVGAVQKDLEAADIKVTGVEAYDPGRGVENLQAIAGSPSDIPAGANVTLYADRGVVRYYAITGESKLNLNTLKADLTAQKTEMEALKLQVKPVMERFSRAEEPTAAGTAAPAFELQSLQAELQSIKETAAQKDQELIALRTKLEALEKKQSSDITSLRKDIGRKG
ncbi:MAG: DUF6519 domain-containing protein [Anaerolineales bacterium]